MLSPGVSISAVAWPTHVTRISPSLSGGRSAGGLGRKAT